MDRFDRTLQDEIAENERWLARFETPGASPQLLARIKSAVRLEACRRGGRSISREWRAWHGTASAAAALMLAAGLGLYSTRLSHDAGTPPSQRASVEVASDSFQAEFAALTAVDEALSDLESTATEEAWALSGTTLYDALHAAVADNREENTGDQGALRVPEVFDAERGVVS